MKHWLYKTEPEELSIESLAALGAKGACWDGVRNFQARNLLRGAEVGDEVFIYHSSCKLIGIAGIAKVIRAAYTDPTQFDPSSVYFDPASKPEHPRWSAVDVRHVETFPRVIPLAELKANPALNELEVVRKGSRLSVMAVTPEQWKAVLKMLG